MLQGLLLLVLPQMYGVGYPVLAAGIAPKYTIVFLLVLLVAKMFATSLTIGIGGSGGVFAPSLFIGAMLGTAFGEIMHIMAPGIAGPVGAYGLIGMGAVFAGAARAPITAVVIPRPAPSWATLVRVGHFCGTRLRCLGCLEDRPSLGRGAVGGAAVFGQWRHLATGSLYDSLVACYTWSMRAFTSHSGHGVGDDS